MSQAESPPADSADPYDSVPGELKERDQWLMWDSSGETPKRPHWKGDFNISWSDPETWHTFETARDAAQARESWGIGYVMAAGNDDYEAGRYACIDIDGGIADDGTLKDWVPDLSRFEATYIEQSTSGTGLHIPVEGRTVPDWWTDGQLGEHEGVDLLQNKFCIVTGDRVDGNPDSIGDVNPAPWLFNAFKQIHGRAPSLETKAESSRAGGREEYLSADDIEEALSHVDPDLPHTEWIKVGFAVHDFDDGSTGKRLFKKWSERGSKYDDAAESSINWIWSDASEGSGVTLGTLIHKAKEGGWTPPKGGSSDVSPGGSARKTPFEEAIDSTWFDDGGQVVKVQPTEEYDAAELVERFEDPDRFTTAETMAVNEVAGGDSFLKNASDWTVRERDRDPYADLSLQELKNVALREIPDERIAWLSKREEWYWCDTSGVWHSHGEEFVRRWLDSEFGDHYRSRLRTELQDQLKARTRVDETSFGGGPPGTIATKSGLLDLETGDCRPIQPDDRVRWRLDTEYDPEADCPRWKAFLGDVVEPDSIPLLQEYIGFCLRHWDLPRKKSLILFGPTDAGKSVFLDVVRALFGGDDSVSTSSTSIQYLANERWGPARLVNTAINIRNDLDNSTIENTGKVKEIIAGDALDAERKRKPVFKFSPTTKHIFAANRAPTRDVDDDGFWNRWLTVFFPESVPREEQDPQLTDKLKAELPGILNWAIDGYARLMEQGQFTNEPYPFENRQKWERYGNSIEQFIERCTDDDGGHVPKRTTSGGTVGAYDSYLRFARNNGLERESLQKFTAELTKRGEVTQRQRTVDGSRTRCYVGLELTDDAPRPESDATDDNEESHGTGLEEYR